MERWEPPRSTGTEAPRRRRPAPEAPKRDVPETGLMVIVRLGIMMVFLLTVLIDDLRELMPWVAFVLIAGLVAVVLQATDAHVHNLRMLTLFDLAILVVLIPVVVLNGFVAAEPGELLPAEQSALLQTSGGLLIVFALLVWLATILFPEERSLVPTAVLPGLIAILSINFVLHDYRNQTVLAMLAVSYFVGAAALALGSMVDEPVRRHVPATFYVATILAGFVLFDPGLSNIFDREGMVQLFFGMMILIGLAVLFIIPNPSFDEFRFGVGARPADERRRRRREQVVERGIDDPGGDAPERS